MKINCIIKLLPILFIFSAAVCSAEEKSYTYELEFGNPKAEKIVQIGGNGDLNISGYKGDKLLISANENIFEKEDEANEKAKGLKKLGGGGFQIVNNKEENCIVISRSIVGRKINLDIKVPNKITLRLGSGNSSKTHEYKGRVRDNGKKIEKHSSSANNQDNNFFAQFTPDPGVFVPQGGNGIIAGNILIRNLEGIVEINTIQGNIDVENMIGELTASSVQGNLKIVFEKLNKDNAIYFSTVNGEIDITLPKGTAADIMAKTLNGNVYSGFDGEVTAENVVTDQTDTSVIQNMVNTFMHPNYITSRINGGGQEIYLSTINGNIYVRKGE